MERTDFARHQREQHPQQNSVTAKLPDWVIVGENCHIPEGVIFSDRGFGYTTENGKHEHIPHAGSCLIGDDVEIMAGANIVRATAEHGCTAIGSGTKIDFGVHVAHNVHIGQNCLVIAGTIIGGSCIIGDNCYLGIGCMIKNKVTIGKGATIGMGAVVLADVPEGAVMVGNPARAMNVKPLNDIKE